MSRASRFSVRLHSLVGHEKVSSLDPDCRGLIEARVEILKFVFAPPVPCGASIEDEITNFHQAIDRNKVCSSRLLKKKVERYCLLSER